MKLGSYIGARHKYGSLSRTAESILNFGFAFTSAYLKQL